MRLTVLNLLVRLTDICILLSHNLPIHSPPVHLKKQGQGAVVRVMRKMAILRVKIGKNFEKNQSKAHIPDDKIRKK